MPTLSVILPVYNVESYLRKCVDSILNQTYKDFELIIVDDGSTDQSSNICDMYETHPLVTVIHRKNGGLSAARNTGIAVAKGEYITFCDSDDWIDSEMYSQMMRSIKKDNSDIVVCGHRVVSESGKVLEEVTTEDMVLDGKTATKYILEDKSIQSFAWNKIYRKELFKEIRYPENRIYEDTACTYLLFYESHQVSLLHNVYYNYLRRANSICLSANKDVYRKRMVDNFRAFYERYQFSVAHEEFIDIVPICAKKAFMMGRNICHTYCKDDSLISKEIFQNVVSKIMELSTKFQLSWKYSIELCLMKLSLKWYTIIVSTFYQLKR